MTERPPRRAASERVGPRSDTRPEPRAPRRAEAAERPTRRGRRIIWPVLACVLFVGVLFVGVFPTQIYLEQRDAAAERREHLDEVNQRNAELQARVDALQDDEAIEMLARKEWGLVYPGEESYAVVGLDDEDGPGAPTPEPGE